ncbi:MAG: PKD domain-containing protein [Dehalococcoidales bacterium]|nr:PKD domain-containing protein [Dehalococcoidales bacterium]
MNCSRIITSGSFWRISLTGFVFCLTIWLCNGCGTANTQPVISTLRYQPDAVVSSDICEIECVAVDAEGDILSYTWLAINGTLSGEGSAVSWTAPDTPGLYTISVIVSDGRGGKSEQQVSIDVTANQPPVIECLSSESLAVGQNLKGTFHCSAYDPEGDTLIYKWKADAGVISGQGAIAIWKAPDTPGNYTISVEVMDDKGGNTTLSTTIDVLPNNDPIIKSLKADPAYIVAGKSSTIECIAYDPDEDGLHYRWETSTGDVFDDSPTIVWTAPANCSTCTIDVTVSDGRGGEVRKEVKVWVRSSGG